MEHYQQTGSVQDEHAAPLSLVQSLVSLWGGSDGGSATTTAAVSSNQRPGGESTAAASSSSLSNHRFTLESLRSCQEVYKSSLSQRVGGGPVAGAIAMKQSEAVLHLAFDELDVSCTGELSRGDIFAFFRQAATNMRLQNVEDILIDMAVDALLEDVGGAAAVATTAQDHAKETITRDQFLNIFRRHPDLMRAFEDEDSLSQMRQSVRENLNEDARWEQELENEQVWRRFNTKFRNMWVEWTWILLYVAGNVAVFTVKAVQYASHQEALAVFGNCVVVARGCAACLNLNSLLILLPICRHLVTWMRGTPCRKYFPFDAMLEAHQLLGLAFLLFAIGHVAAHICDFHRFAYADEINLYALFGDKLGVPIPEDPGDRWKLMLKQPAGVTGLIMVSCMVVAYPAILARRKHFNVFWSTHHLLVVMLIALIFHGMGNLLEPYESVYWVIVPLVIYLASRVLRETSLSSASVLNAEIKSGGIVHLQLAKPPGWKHMQSGMYSFLNIPQISCIEWHPFTLTSTPDDPYISFHFAPVGDWTKSVQEFLLSNNAPDATKATADEEEDRKDRPERNRADATTSLSNVKFRVDGPMGASSQGFSDFPVVILVGAGIGITPMISVVKYLLEHPGRMRRTYFYWTARDQSAFALFADVLNDIYEKDVANRLHIYHFLTSMRYDDRDFGQILLAHAATCKHDKTNFDLLLGRRTRHMIDCGRPNWATELTNIKSEATDLGFADCGIFLCGPEPMAKELSQVSAELSDPTDFHFSFTKETF